MSTAAYLALGDSYTIGEAVEPEDRWPEQLAARLRAEGHALDAPRIIATTGWTTDELATALDALEAGSLTGSRATHEAVHEASHDATDQSAPGRDHALVSLLIGVNNQYRGRGLQEYSAQFDALLLRAIGYAGGDATRVLVLAIPDWGRTPFGAVSGRDPGRVSAELDAFNAAAARSARACGAAFVDIAPATRALSPHPDMHADDGLHPSRALYAAWLEVTLPAARAALTGQHA